MWPWKAASSKASPPLRRRIRELLPASAPGAPLLGQIADKYVSPAGVLNETGVLAALNDAGALADAEAAARALVGLDPSLHRVGAHLADLLARRGAREEAEALYRRILVDRPDEPAALRGHACLLDDLKRAPEPVEEAYRRAVIANPLDRTLLARWLTCLDRRRADRQQALTDLQASADEVVWSVITALLDRNTAMEELDKAFGLQFERFRDSETFRAIDAIWTSFVALRPFTPEAREGLKASRGLASQLYFLLRRPGVSRYAIVDAKARAKATADFGIDLDALARYLEERFLGVGSSEWLAFLDKDVAFASAAIRRTVFTCDHLCLFQEEAVRQRAIRFLHPIDRVEVEPFDSFILNGRTVYSYPGSTVFMLITGGGGNRAICGYLPGPNILIDFNSGLRQPMSDTGLASLFSGMLNRFHDHAERYEAALSAPAVQGDPRKVCLALGTIQNFAHHLWNFHTGFERIVRAGVAANVDEIHFAGSQFFGPIDALFPEFVNARCVAYPRGMLDPHPFSAEHVLIQPGGYFIPRTLSDRVVRAMEACRPTGAETVEPGSRGERPFPIIWIGLRLGDKSWLGQESEVATVVDRISEVYPEALFVLDGFSYPVGTDDISGTWTHVIEALQGIAAEIASGCRVPERVISLIGNTLRESVLWAQATDLYVAPRGTSQHKVGWLSSAPGIIYASRTLEQSYPERRPGVWEAEISGSATYIFGDPADAGARRGVNDRRERIDNVKLDLDTLVALMLDKLAERAASRM